MGDHEGTIYRRAELKELVNLHSKSAMGHLSDDEVKIIGNVLELKCIIYLLTSFNSK